MIRSGMTYSPTARSGFTLAELSVVLVLLGLIAGGIVAGQSLIYKMQLRSIGDQYHAFHDAIGLFQDRYQSLPGDFSGASNVWTGTANGDGDGLVDIDTDELFLVWRHMQLAGMIDGEYTGTTTNPMSAPSYHIIGTNAPDSSFEGFGWAFVSYTAAPNATAFNVTYGNTLVFGKQTTNNLPNGVALTPGTTEAVDAKFDDGFPAYGRLIAPWGGNCTNAANATDLEGTYSVARRDPLCILYFVRVHE